MKSILYTLIYTNDTISLNYLTYNIDKTNHKFTFCKNPNIEKICKVFMIIINNFYRKEDLNRTIMYDFYVKKILALLVGDGGFYVNSLENCLEIEDYEMKLLTNNDYYLEVRQNIYTPYLDKINNFDLKMGILNRQYFDYGINLQNYIEKTNEVMGEETLAALKAIENTEQVKLVGFDSGTDQVKAVREGKEYGLISQNPYSLGYAAIVAAVRAATDLPVDSFVDTGYQWLDQETIDLEENQKYIYE